MKTNTKTQEEEHTCYHCGTPILNKEERSHEKVFCCSGCKMVYEILQQNDLCTYYDLNQHPGQFQQEAIRTGKFSYLDQQEVASKIVAFKDASQTHVLFYLPQMHCSSCLWILEQLYKLNSGIKTTQVNFNQKELFINFNHNEISLRAVVELLASIGYEPHLSLNSLDAHTPIKPNQDLLYKIGIAGFCFSNIMLLSFPEYLSGQEEVEPIIKTTFRAISLLLALPVLFYSATDFFKNAYQGLQKKFLHLDLPIALAIAITFLRSIYDIATNTSGGYLDSMSGIVFFMLIGRWLQNYTQDHLAFDKDYRSFFPIAVSVRHADQSLSSKPIEQVLVNDCIEIYSNELIPVDALVSKGEALIDYSFVNGESQPVPVGIGEMVYAGGKQIGERIELLVVKPVAQSYLTNLWQKNQSVKSNELKENWLDVLGKNFTYFVLLLASLAGAYWLWKGAPATALHVLTTVLIIACPCALLLASSFTIGHLQNLLTINQCYFKHPSLLDTSTHITDIVFDKTGTLTDTKKFTITSSLELDTHTKLLIASLLFNSKHPLNVSLWSYLGLTSQEILKVKAFKEQIGKGIEAIIDQKHLQIGSSNWLMQEHPHLQLPKMKHGSSVHCTIDGNYLCSFEIKNEYRLHVLETLSTLQNDYKVHLLSGDLDHEKEFLQQYIPLAQLQFNQKPDDKQNYILNLQQQNAKVLMIGDGLNDALALQKSDIGMAVSDQSNNFTPSSDVIIAAQELQHLPQLLKFINHHTTTIAICFIISVIYNIIGLFYALQGALKPVIAAILMPASSISIILMTYLLNIYWAKQLKLKTQKD